METVGTLILIPGVFALLLTVGYHLVSLFVQGERVRRPYMAFPFLKNLLQEDL